VVQRTAIISPCGKYRYEARRTWRPQLAPMLVIGLNPSTADHEFDDRSMTQMMYFADKNGYGSVLVGNLGAGRNTKPSLWKAMRDPIGPDNDETLRRLICEVRDAGGVVVVAWGVNGQFKDRANIVLGIISECGVSPWCWGKTQQAGAPKHPLYLAHKTKLRRY
jgi:hypothetical protein